MALFAVLGSSAAVSDCIWAFNYSSKHWGYGNAYEACAVGVSTIYAYDKKITRIERVPGSSVVYRCHAMIQPCKTCNWETPNPPWKINGLDMTAHLVSQQGDTLDSALVDNSTGTCIQPEASVQLGPSDKNNCSVSPGVGNPINAVTGNKHQAEFVYASASGAINVSLTYNSYSPRWLHSYSDRLAITEGYIYYFNSQGKSSTFSKLGSSITGITPQSGVLTQAGSGYWLTHPLAGRIKFDSRGRAEEITRVGRNRVAIKYEADSVRNLISSSIAQRKLTLSSDSGETVVLSDDSIGGFTRLSAGNVTAGFGFYTTGMPAMLVRTIDGVTPQERRYIYGDSRFPKYLTAVYDERRVKYAAWSYDAMGRAISSEHAEGADRVSIFYNNDGSSTVTNSLGKKITYRFSIINGLKLITAIEGEPSANCPSSNSKYIYDERGLLKTKTDNKGHLTVYDYNSYDLEVSRTEGANTAEARTITTEWHPTLLLPVAVTEPTRITTYTYDEQGRQLSQSVTQR